MKVTSGILGSHFGTRPLWTTVLVSLALGIALTLLLVPGSVAADGQDEFTAPIVLEEIRTPPDFNGQQSSNRSVVANKASVNSQGGSSGSSTVSVNNSGSSGAPLNCMGANASQGECLKLTVNRASGMCGSAERPRLSFEDVRNGIEYRCHGSEGVWVKFQYERTAAEHELIKYPVGPCDRQQTVYDTIREKEFFRVNENYSQEECDAHIASLLDSALEAKRKQWGNGPAVAFCTVISSPGDSQGNAYGQVFLFTPSGDGHNGASTLVFHGLYDTAVNFANSASSCNP